MCCDPLDHPVTPTTEEPRRIALSDVLALVGDTDLDDDALAFILEGLALERNLAVAERRLLDAGQRPDCEVNAPDTV